MEIIPSAEFEFRHFMRWLAKATEKYFEDPEVQKRFEEWKKERDAKENEEANVAV